MPDRPLAYFLTFHTYGTWLPGHESGSVDDAHNRYGDPLLRSNAAQSEFADREMQFMPLIFTDEHWRIVLETIVEVAAHRKWRLHAVQVRTTHVHVVVSSDRDPEQTMNDFKSWATRRLREAGAIGDDRPVWSRHGSTPHLWTEEQVAGAVRYTLHEQGAVLVGSVYPETAY